MRWNWIAVVAAVAVITGFACAQAGAAELSVTNRLQDRREVAAGQRSYAEGFQDGRFYANGWHTTGEMGGVWAPPVKLADGVWFGLDGSWIGPATRFTSGWGYTRYDLPQTDGLQLRRTDFAPDADRAVLFGLTLTNPGAARRVTVNVDAHSELMGAYPWGSTTPNESTNVPDHGAFRGGALVFTDDGTVRVRPPSTTTRHWSPPTAPPRRGQLRPPAGASAAPRAGRRARPPTAPPPRARVTTGRMAGAPAAS
jgi:hypothetical protein